MLHHVPPLRERCANLRMRHRRRIPIVTRACIAGVVLATCTAAGAQVLASQDEQTDVSLAMNAAGTLSLTEWYDLGDLQTTSGSLIECDIVIVKLLGGGDDGATSVGLKMEADDGRRSAFVDRGEIDGILAAIATIDDTGIGLLIAALAGDLSGELRRSSQIGYRTKEGVTIAAFERRGELRYAIQIGSRSDWYILSESGEAAFRRNLLLASEVAAAVDTGSS